MEYIKNNWKTLLFCLGIVLLSIIIYFIYNQDKEYTYEIDDNYYRNYEINEVIPVYVSEEDLAKKYLADYINLIYNDIEKAYDLLSSESKDKYDSIDDFENYINTLKDDNFYKAKVSKYAYITENKKKHMTIIDMNYNTFIFIEENIMNYKVTIK